MTWRYEDVRKLKNGYGGYNLIRGRHTDRKKGFIVGAVVIGGLAALIGAVAAAK